MSVCMAVAVPDLELKGACCSSRSSVHSMGTGKQPKSQGFKV
jgi:hypothetical protein